MQGLFEAFTHSLDLACIITHNTCRDDPVRRAGTNVSLYM